MIGKWRQNLKPRLIPNTLKEQAKNIKSRNYPRVPSLSLVIPDDKRKQIKRTSCATM